AFTIRRRAAPLVFRFLDVRSLLALRTIDNLELHLFPFAEGLKTSALDRREVDKNVFATLTSNESIALAIIKPLDRTSWHATFSVPVHNAELMRASGKAPPLKLQTAERGEGKPDYAKHTHSLPQFPGTNSLHCGGYYSNGGVSCQAKALPPSARSTLSAQLTCAY